MKKIFSLMMVLAVAIAANATDYYFAGAANSWSNNNEEWKFVDVDGVLTLSVAEVYGEFKICEDGNWHPQHGFNNGQTGLSEIGGSVTLVKCDDSQGEADTEANASFDFSALGEDYRCKNAVLTFDPATEVLTLVSGTMYDHSAAPVVYCLVGACTDNWSTSAAIEFQEVEGVLTATVPNLNGGFKIIKNHEWGWEAAANGNEALGFNTPMTLVTADGNNINLANPFGGYSNAVVTLDVTDEAAPVLTLVGGEFALGEAHWYFPGSMLGWNCNETTEFTPVEGQANTYEYLAAELGKDFKVVFGVWGVEFGAPKGEVLNWTVNEPMTLATPCDNITAADNDQVLTDVTATIVVDYEAITCELTLGVEATALESIMAQPGAEKVMENGRLIIIKDGVRYTAKGEKL